MVHRFLGYTFVATLQICRMVFIVKLWIVYFRGIIPEMYWRCSKSSGKLRLVILLVLKVVILITIAVL